MLDNTLTFPKMDKKFSEGESRFLLTFSVEVTDGFLLATLPAALIDSTELKLKDSYQWQPVQTYVTISKHFAVRAIGIRFRASLKDCNTVMQQLAYHVSSVNFLHYKT